MTTCGLPGVNRDVVCYFQAQALKSYCGHLSSFFHYPSHRGHLLRRPPVPKEPGTQSHCMEDSFPGGFPCMYEFGLSH